MAHNVQSMMYYGKVPWHGLGTQLDRPATAEEAIKAADLDWEVEKQPLYTAGEKRKIKAPDHFAMVRKDRFAEATSGNDKKIKCPILGVVSKRYTPLQNRKAFAFFDPLVGSDDAIYHTAGALGDGERIWILAKLPGHIRVVGDDITHKYLLLSNSHDGNSSVQIKFTPIRVVCQNTLCMALGYGKTIKVPHFSTLPKRLKEAQDLLGIIETNYSSIEGSFKEMSKVSMSHTKLHSYYNWVIPLPTTFDSLVAEKRYKYIKKQHVSFQELFEEGHGNNMKGVTGTLWAAYNSVVEFVDYKKTNSSMDKRLERIWFGRGAAIKAKAFRVAESWPKIQEAA